MFPFCPELQRGGPQGTAWRPRRTWRHESGVPAVPGPLPRNSMSGNPVDYSNLWYRYTTTYTLGCVASDRFS